MLGRHLLCSPMPFSVRSKSSAFFIGQPEARVHVSDLVVHVSALVFLPLQISWWGFFLYFLLVLFPYRNLEFLMLHHGWAKWVWASLFKK